MSQKLRVEIYIPTLYNADETGIRQPIETRKHRQVKNEIVDKYGAISIHPLTVSGIWVHPTTKERYYDNCYRFEICIDPKEDIETELENWKEELKRLFKQFEIFMTYYNIYAV